MDFLGLIYPVASFVFLRGAVRMFAVWALKDRIWNFLAGVVLMGLSIDAGFRLFEIIAVAPNWWFRPLLVVAYLVVLYGSLRKNWRQFAIAENLRNGDISGS